MIYRYMYLGYGPIGSVQKLSGTRASHISVASFGNRLFLYYESTAADTQPEEVVTATLSPYPDGTVWKPMMNIFHYSRPLSDEQWERKIPGKRPVFNVNRLRPEKYASYVFLHYQYQEERPCEIDKYGAIFVDGNFMVMYLEEPCEECTEKYEGSLKTHNTPENWGELMTEHFLPWEDFDGEWRPSDSIQAFWS